MPRKKLEKVSTDKFFGTFAICNNKGGTGKSTISINLSSELARQGYRVLVVDLDAQANLTFGLGAEKSESHVLSDSPKIVNTKSGVDLIAGHLYLANAQIKDTAFLAEKISHARFTETYNFIFIDCPPSLSEMTVAAILASNTILIPVELAEFSMDGLENIVMFASEIAKEANKKLETIVVPNKVKGRRKNALALLSKLQEEFGQIVYPEIHDSSAIEDSQRYKKTVREYQPSSRSAREFGILAKKFLSHVREK